MSGKSKSKAKAAGVKSAFVVGDQVLLTSFGKGNQAIPEKQITADTIEQLSDSPAYDVSIPAPEAFAIQSHRAKSLQAVSDNPLYAKTESNPIGIDCLHAKDALEKQVFGKTFADDNIHIQLIYNILDIRKILSVYANNIVFSLNNLRRLEEQPREHDYIGKLYTGNSFQEIRESNRLCNSSEIEDSIKLMDMSEQQYEKLELKSKSYEFYRKYIREISPYTGYFTEAFYSEPVSGKISRRSDADIYNLLRLMSVIRQVCMHDNNSMRTLLYSFEDPQYFTKVCQNAPGAGYPELRNLVERIYDEKIDKVNADFIRNQKNNIEILCRVYDTNGQERSALVREFYLFKVYKQEKNLGFSIKKLREKLLENSGYAFIKEKKYDSARSKIYSLADFILYRYFCAHEYTLSCFVDKLRGTLCEEEKEQAYADMVRPIEPDIRGLIRKKLMPQMDGKSLQQLKGQKLNEKDLTDDLKLSSTSSYFTKIIYAVCLFLDGKEINELVSALINKFSNVQSFLDVMHSQGIDCTFTEEYGIFEKSGVISDEMRTLLSISRMQKSIAGVGDLKVSGDDGKAHGVSAALMKDAIYLLGFDGDEQQMKDFLDQKIFLKGDTNLRNFLINNVLKNRRFLYAVRYMNPKRAKKLVDNPELVKLVLSGIPQTQIDRYYASCIHPYARGLSAEQKISKLSEMICGMSVYAIQDVRQKADRKNPEVSRRKERYKACVSLYLTVLYLICKNLVKINARYTIAIGCLERDTQLLARDAHLLERYEKLLEHDEKLLKRYEKLKESDKKLKEKKEKDMAYFMTRDLFMKEKWIHTDKPAVRQMKKDYENLTLYLAQVYRNQIAHLAVITNAYRYVELLNSEKLKKASSFFWVYHSIMQMSMMQQIEHDTTNPSITVDLSEREKILLEAANDHHSYSRELLRILNLPYGYNVARYKNLTYANLFDMHEE